MAPRIVLAALAGAALLIAWTARNSKRFYRDYAFTGAFDGKVQECWLGGLATKAPTLCFAGADRTGIYLLAPPAQRRRWNIFGTSRGVLKQSLHLPWTDFEARAGLAAFRKVIWLRFDARRIYLYVPREIGLALLLAGGRAVPQ